MTGPAASDGARKLTTRSVEKVWGRDILPPPFAAETDTRIGEIWFDPPPQLPQLLVKYLFTSEKLSVQVHPSDEQALAEEEGKEECWLVLDADPGASLAIGFKQAVSRDAVRRAAQDGSIEDLLAWHEAKPGDVFYLPAGTVHAIGPGLSLVEVQQNSDTTFRLYDYGRPRQLHLDRAMAVANCGPYPARYRGTVKKDGPTLIDGAHFRLDRVEGRPDASIEEVYSNGMLALPLSGGVSARDGSASVDAGECLYAPNLASLDFSAAEVTLLTRPARS
ncbi:class I mannose-6-phosphate isomerase [Erythrobacter rubeus]|uniref:Class I mannose-6-phosphate isomerase n=1 Tax=Erythrobacter rubeus TaxID=2760803 RepID=A0ABR8KQ23_9SPHN|nr:class I mannose-6-phosphate isomerase [Erythrobacter rubeus]MBD2842841.1 class I mannose-6-phosphate isomerase [Erythrobacter rubeus]